MDTFHSPDHERLNVLAGAWDTTITMLSADGTSGNVSQASDIYTWMAGGHFLVQEVDAEVDGQRIQSIEIFGVDPESGDFLSHSYDPDGNINEFRSRIDGRAYTIEGKVQRFAGAFSPDGTILEGECKQLIAGEWLPFVRIRLEKRRSAD